jgi:hypothetical protein
MKEAKFEEYGCSTRFVVYGKNCDRKEKEEERYRDGNGV